MTPEAADYLAKAREALSKAQYLVDDARYNDEAARAAYLAAFHAAQALIFTRLGKSVKSHSGLRSTFARLSKDDPFIDRTYSRFLARAYKFKEVADYAVGTQIVVSAADARELIATAQEFVDHIAAVLDR